MRGRWIGCALLVVATMEGCNRDPLVDGPRTCMGEIRVEIPPRGSHKADLLFVLDNSNGQGPIYLPLLNGVFDSLERLAQEGLPLDLQIGVITTDYGAGATGAPGCQPSPGGQQGRLQAVGSAAPNTCKPPMGANYIRFDYANPPGSNLPIGQDLRASFECMTSTGANGCGFEHVLEATYAALHNNLPESAGFVRDDAVLAVIFATDEDDCSAAPDTDLFDKNKTAQYGYEASFRCTRFGLVCGKYSLPPEYGSSKGPIAGCVPAPNPDGAGPGRLYDIHRYTDLFTRPAGRGGVKANPADVVLIGVTGPDAPLEVILSNPGTSGSTPYVECGQLNEASNPPCVPVLQNSCRDLAAPVFAGWPAVRLNTVIRAAKRHALYSVCATDDAPVFQGLTAHLAARVGAGCIAGRLPDPVSPDCVAEEVTRNSDGTTSIFELRSCASGAAPPCWRVERKDYCGAFSPQSLAVSVDRGGQGAPPDTETRVTCATEC